MIVAFTLTSRLLCLDVDVQMAVVALYRAPRGGRRLGSRGLRLRVPALARLLLVLATLPVVLRELDAEDGVDVAVGFDRADVVHRSVLATCGAWPPCRSSA